MPDHEHAMLSYAKLAAISWQKGQLPGRDKFLVLTGAAACRAGWPKVAQRCRELVLENNSAHLLGREESFAASMRSADFAPFLKQLERFCSHEKAEHLLAELRIDNRENDDEAAGDSVLAILVRPSERTFLN